MKIKHNFIILFVLALFLVSCDEEIESDNTKKPQKSPESGTIQGNKYHNNFFNFSIEVIGNWEIQSEEFLLNAKKQTQNKTNVLFAAIKQTETKLRSNIVISAEKIDLPNKPQNSEEHIKNAISALKRGRIKYDIGEIEKINLGEKTFDYVHTGFYLNGVRIYQDIYTVYIENYALIIVAMYQNQEEKSEKEKILSTLKFEK